MKWNGLEEKYKEKCPKTIKSIQNFPCNESLSQKAGAHLNQPLYVDGMHITLRQKFSTSIQPISGKKH